MDFNKKNVLGVIGLVLILETIVFWWSGQMSQLETVRYSLAARWSARVSLVFLFSLSAWVSLIGLNRIFEEIKRRDMFILIVSLIAFNHLIHFVFLYVNHLVNNYELLTLRSAGGALGYLVLTTAPFYLWNKVQLTKQVYWSTMGTITLLLVISVVSYLGRWNKDLPMASPKELYVGVMATAIVLLIMNVYRIFADRKLNLTS